MEINELIKIAEYLKLQNVSGELRNLEQRLQGNNIPLILPLVGEFSSGKTSLLNVLTDSKQLEVATKPTTATIYQLHFGQEKQSATIVKADGSEETIESIDKLDNSVLGDIPLVKIYDTSTRVPKELILVDTPGLSSPDPKHKDALINFLPQADALLMTVDCNQQITNSLLRFIEESNLAGRKVYLIVTKCDTKPAADIENIKNYISDNCKLPMEHVICISAQKEELSEFYSLIDKLIKNKKEILISSVNARIESLKILLSENIKQLLKLPNSTEELEEALYKHKDIIKKTNEEIDGLISSVKYSVEEVSEEMIRHYQSLLFQRLDMLLAQKGDNLTAEANTIVNSASALVMTEYRNKITQELSKQAEDSSFFIRSAVTRLDLSNLEGPNSEINIDIDDIGHEMDKNIAKGLQVAAIAAVAVAAFPAAANATISATGITASSVRSASTMASVADTATDVGSILYMRKLRRYSTKMVQAGSKFAENYNTVQNKMSPKVKGVIESLVGKATEHLLAKPKRRRIINDIIEQQLIPDFTFRMEHNINVILSGLQGAISEESEQILAEHSAQISELKNAIEAQNGEYQKKISTLQEYHKTLNYKK